MTRRHRSTLLAGVVTALAVGLAVPGTAAAIPADLWITQYVAGPGADQAIEISNVTGGSVSLASYAVDVHTAGGAVTTVALPAASLAHGDSWVLAPAGAGAGIAAVRDQVLPTTFDGDDAVVLRLGGTVIDSIGQAGVDPGAEWRGTNAVTGLQAGTANGALVKRTCAATGDVTTGDAYDPALEWQPGPADATGLGAPGSCWRAYARAVDAWYGTVTASDGASAPATGVELSDHVPAALAAAIAGANPDPGRVGTLPAAFTTGQAPLPWATASAEGLPAEQRLRDRFAAYPAAAGRSGTVSAGAPGAPVVRRYVFASVTIPPLMGGRAGLGRAAAGLLMAAEDQAVGAVTFRALDATFTPASAGGGTTTVQPPQTGSTGPAGTTRATGPAGAAPTFSSVVTLPTAKRCASRRSFRIRLTNPPRTRIASAVVEVDGRRVATRKGARVTAPVNLRGLPKGRFTVRITVKLTDGRTVTGRRAYRTCTKRDAKGGRVKR